MAHLYVASAWHAWHIINRTAFDNLAVIGVGLAAFLARSKRTAKWVPWTIVGLVGLWNVPFVLAGFPGGPTEVVASWLRGLAFLVGR